MNGTAFRSGLATLLLVVSAILPAATRAEDPSPRPHVVVGSELDYPPYAVVRDGQADGFSVDLMKAVCEAMGIDLTFRVGPWSEMRAALEKGEIDALPLVAYSKERAAIFDFTLPHTVAHGVIFRRKRTPGIESGVDLRDKAIIVMRADAGHDWLLRNDISNRLVLAPTVEESFRLLAQGKGDYVLAPRLVGLLILRELNLPGIETTGPLIDAYGRGYGFAVRKGNASLLLQFNEGLRIVKETGRYDEIYEKWFGIVDPPGIPQADIFRYVQWAILTVFVLGILAPAWIVILRHTVKARTLELQVARDGLERLVAERTQELMDRNFILDAVIDGSADAIFVKDREGRIVHANRVMARNFGIDAASLLGKDADDLHPPPVAAGVKAKDDAVIATGVESDTEETLVFHGEERIFHTFKTPYRDAEGAIIGLIGIARDITERKRAEEALRESEARLRAVFENVPIALHLKDIEGRYLFVNEPYLEWLGRSTEEVLGRTGRDFYPDPEAFVRLTENERRVVETGDVVDDEITVQRAGATFYRKIIKFPVKAESGAITGIGTAAMDITERRRAEETLRESEVRTRLLLGGVALGIGVEDLDGKTISPNEGLARMLGYTPEELRAMRFTEYTHPDYAGRDAAFFREMAAGQRDGYQMEKRYITKDGRVVWGRLTRTVVRGQDGKPQYCLGMVENITERKQAEAALRESEERFAKAFRASPAPMSISLIDSGLTLDVNDEWLRMLGFARDEVIGKTSAELGAWAGATPRAAFIDLLKKQGSFRDFEATVMTKTGQVRRVILAAETIDRDRMLLVFHDITERLEMEHRLAHAQKMEAVGQLTGGIAHDFNNLLQVVMINMELARDRVADDDQTQRHLQAAIAAGQRGAKLTQQLLSFSRQQLLRPSVVDANRLVEGMLDLLARTLGEDVEIETRLQEGLPSIMVDPHGLENALLNLAVNARAAMPKGGRLTIGTGRRHLDRDHVVEDETLKAGDYVEVAVADTGCGMPADVLARAFEPFFTTKEVGEGSGLGLSMVYGFTRQSGGQATLESQVGKGATVTLLLPVAEAQAETRERTTRRVQGPVAGSRVLVVEDDPDVRSATALVLKACGCEVREAEDGMAALAILDADRTIDLLFSDVVMPKGMNGVELAGEAVHRHAGLKVILTSGYPDAALAKSGFAEKGFRLLRKPFRKADLVQALASALGGVKEKINGPSDP